MDRFIKTLVMVVVAFLCLWLVIEIAGCAHDDQGDEESLGMTASAKRDLIVSQIPEVQDKYGFVGTRCDGTTFTALLMAFSSVEVNIGLAETEPGKWSRHVEPCYPDASQSETSLDVYLMVLHWLLSMPDRQAASNVLARIIERGESSGWIMGQGPVKFTNILVLVPLIMEMEGLFKGNAKSELTVAESSDSIPILTGHKGHIAAFIILLHGRIAGHVTTAELLLLEQMAGDSPRNPIYQAIYHRFKDGDQSALEDIIINDFRDEINDGVGCFGWGSSACSLFVIASVGIAEGV